MLLSQLYEAVSQHVQVWQPVLANHNPIHLTPDLCFATQYGDHLLLCKFPAKFVPVPKNNDYKNLKLQAAFYLSVSCGIPKTKWSNILYMDTSLLYHVSITVAGNKKTVTSYCNRKPQHLVVCNLRCLWCHIFRYASLKGQTAEDAVRERDRTYQCIQPPETSHTFERERGG